MSSRVLNMPVLAFDEDKVRSGAGLRDFAKARTSFSWILIVDAWAEPFGSLGDPFPQCAAKAYFIFAERHRSIASRLVTGAVRGAASAGGEQCGFGEGEPKDHHAVVEQGEHHAEQSALLAAMQAAGGGEYCGGFAG